MATEMKTSLETAEYHLGLAEGTLRDGAFADCVYHSAVAAENAVNALILKLGGRPPHTHRDADTLEKVTARKKPEWLKGEDYGRMLERMRELEEHVVKARYPIEIKDGFFLPPHKFYKKKDAGQALRNARSVINGIKRYLSRKV